MTQNKQSEELVSEIIDGLRLDLMLESIFKTLYRMSKRKPGVL